MYKCSIVIKKESQSANTIKDIVVHVLREYPKHAIKPDPPYALRPEIIEHLNDGSSRFSFQSVNLELVIIFLKQVQEKLLDNNFIITGFEGKLQA